MSYRGTNKLHELFFKATGNMGGYGPIQLVTTESVESHYLNAGLGVNNGLSLGTGIAIDSAKAAALAAANANAVSELPPAPPLPPNTDPIIFDSPTRPSLPYNPTGGVVGPTKGPTNQGSFQKNAEQPKKTLLTTRNIVISMLIIGAIMYYLYTNKKS